MLVSDKAQPLAPGSVLYSYPVGLGPLPRERRVGAKGKEHTKSRSPALLLGAGGPASEDEEGSPSVLT